MIQKKIIIKRCICTLNAIIQYQNVELKPYKKKSWKERQGLMGGKIDKHRNECTVSSNIRHEIQKLF